MQKRVSVLITVLFLFTTAVQAEEKGKGLLDSRASLQLSGNIASYYKNQEDYHTPLDTDVRSGANNRSKQNTRTQGTITFLSKAGEAYSERNSEFIGVYQIIVDADDPDHPDNKDANTDGQRKVRFDNKELWIRYSPMEAVGVKIGTQTVAATSLAANVHLYRGDYDNDFIFYTAATLLEMPGITADLHLSKDIEFGVGMVEGMGDASMIASGGSPSEAANTVAWFKGGFGPVEVGLAQQSIKVGGEEKEEDPATTHWEQKYKHTVQNLWAKATFGAFTPYVGYQMIDGKSVPWSRKFYVDVSLPDGSNQQGEYTHAVESEDMEATFTSVGLLAAIGPGQLAVDYTQIKTPEYSEKGAINAIIELDNATQVNYTIPIGEGSSISFFYHVLKAKGDSKRKDVEAKARNGAKQAAALFAKAEAENNSVASETYRDKAAEYTIQAGLLEKLQWTGSTSYGIQFQMNFAGAF